MHQDYSYGDSSGFSPDSLLMIKLLLLSYQNGHKLAILVISDYGYFAQHVENL
jgi:hypothetical protein